METCCDFCAYNEYDDDDEEYYCSVNMDEDDMARFVQSSYKKCPFYRSGGIHGGRTNCGYDSHSLRLYLHICCFYVTFSIIRTCYTNCT